MAGVKGRSGSKTGKMTPEAVANFKAEMHDGEPVTVKAKRYPITAKSLCEIRNGQTFAHIKPAETADKLKIWEAV